MTEPSELEPVDRLVRSYLDRATEQTDATDLLARIRASQAAESPRPSRARTARWLVWGVLTSAAVILAFLGGRQFGPQPLFAAAVVREARYVHANVVDRSYLVQFVPDPATWNPQNRLEGPSRSVLWTRGDDRFWADCEIANLKLAIGRDEHGMLWAASSRDKGVRFSNEPSQLPADIAVLCDINSMSIPRLLDDVLADFELRGDEVLTSDGDRRSVVWAGLKPGRTHSLLANAMLEIDAESNVIVRLVLWTVREDGRPKGTVTFTLLRSARPDDAQYRLESHLDADAEIDTQTMGRQEP